MRVLVLAQAFLANAFYAWALREIHPLHPDVPKIVLWKRKHEETLHKFYA